MESVTKRNAYEGKAHKMGKTVYKILLAQQKAISHILQIPNGQKGVARYKLSKAVGKMGRLRRQTRCPAASQRGLALRERAWPHSRANLNARPCAGGQARGAEWERGCKQ